MAFGASKMLNAVAESDSVNVCVLAEWARWSLGETGSFVGLGEGLEVGGHGAKI